MSGLVLEHIRDLGLFFGEARRVLKPQGRAVISAMHPAMFLRGSQARFTDPDSGELVQPGSIAHTISDFVMAAVQTGCQIEHIGEYAPDAAFAAQLSARREVHRLADAGGDGADNLAGRPRLPGPGPCSGPAKVSHLRHNELLASRARNS